MEEYTHREPHTLTFIKDGVTTYVNVDHMGIVEITEEMLAQLLVELGWELTPNE